MKDLNWNQIYTEYKDGKTINEIAKENHIHASSVRLGFYRNHFVLRSKKEANVLSSSKRSGKNHWKYCGTERVDYQGRIFIKINNKWILKHRYIFEQKYGKIPKGYIIHHIDEDNTNNSIENLRMVTWDEHNKIHHLGVKRG